MRAAGRIVSLTVLVGLAAAPGQSQLKAQAEAALRWYGRWVAAPSPAITKCRSFVTAEISLLRCDNPGVDILSENQRVNAILYSADLTLEESLRRFGRRPPREGASVWVKRNEYIRCNIDAQLTERLESEALARFRKYQNDRWNRLMFPWVCRGDPLYHVYGMHNEEVVTVWELVITERDLVLHWEFDRDRPQRELPKIVRPNAKNPSLWFRSVVVPRR